MIYYMLVIPLKGILVLILLTFLQMLISSFIMLFFSFVINYSISRVCCPPYYTPFMSYMQLRAKDIGLDSSQLECLIRVTGVAGSIPGPSIYFYHLFCSFLFSNYNIIIQTIQQCTVNQFLFATTLFRDSLAINWFATTKFRE